MWTRLYVKLLQTGLAAVCTYVASTWPKGGVNGAYTNGVCCVWDAPPVPVERPPGGEQNIHARGGFNGHRYLTHAR